MSSAQEAKQGQLRRLEYGFRLRLPGHKRVEPGGGRVRYVRQRRVVKLAKVTVGQGAGRKQAVA
jgi:hypothetical protein